MLKPLMSAIDATTVKIRADRTHTDVAAPEQVAQALHV